MSSKREAYKGEAYHGGRWHSLHCLQGVSEGKKRMTEEQPDDPTNQEKSMLLTDQEKSDLLCNLAGMPKGQFGITGPEGPEWEFVWPDLYEVDEDGDPLHLPLAWKVLNWWTEDEADRPWVQWAEFSGFWEDGFLTQLPAADAQRLWLDKILKLAIDADLVELEEETAQ